MWQEQEGILKGMQVWGQLSRGRVWRTWEEEQVGRNSNECSLGIFGDALEWKSGEALDTSLEVQTE